LRTVRTSSGAELTFQHGGIDIVLATPGAIEGMLTPVLWDGEIVDIRREDDDGDPTTNPWGNYAALALDVGGYAGFAHLGRLGVSLGQRVSPGDSLGPCDSTGHSTGHHWHLQCTTRESIDDLLRSWLTVDPITFLQDLSYEKFGPGSGDQDTTRAQIAMIRRVVQDWKQPDGRSSFTSFNSMHAIAKIIGE